MGCGGAAAAGDTVTNRTIVTQGNASTTLGGTIDSTTLYLIDGSIDCSGFSIEVPAGGIFIAGLNLDLSELTCSDASYTLFTSPGGGSGNVFMQNLSIEISGTNSKVYDLTDATGFSAVELLRVNFNNCTSLGILNDYRQGLENGTGRFGGTPSLTLSGSWNGYRVTTSIVRALAAGMTGALFQEGTSFTMSSRFLTDMNCDLPASAALLDFQKANFTSPSVLQIHGAIITRNGTQDPTDNNLTPNISADAAESDWRANIGLKNTFVGGRQTVTSANTTTVSAGSTWYTLNGVWSASDLVHFDDPNDITGAGELRHLGNSPREFKVTAKLVIESTANNVLGIRYRKYDASTTSYTTFTEQQRQVNSLVGGRDVAIFDMIEYMSLDINDYVYIQVRNNSGNNNVTCEVDSFFVVSER